LSFFYKGYYGRNYIFVLWHNNSGMSGTTCSGISGTTWNGLSNFLTMYLNINVQDVNIYLQKITQFALIVKKKDIK